MPSFARSACPAKICGGARRRRFLIALSVTLFVFVVADAWGRNLLVDFRTLLGRTLGEKIGSDISIGSLDGGILRNVALNGIRLRGGEIAVKRVILGLRIWDIALGRMSALRRIKIVGPSMHLDTHGAEVFAFLSKDRSPINRLSVSISEGKIVLEPWKAAICDLHGEIYLDGRTIRLKRVRGLLFGASHINPAGIMRGTPHINPFGILRGTPIEVNGEIKTDTARCNLNIMLTGKSWGYSGRIYGALSNPALAGNMTVMDKVVFPVRGFLSMRDGSFLVEDFSLGAKEESASPIGAEMPAASAVESPASSLLLSISADEKKSTNLSMALDKVFVRGVLLSSYAEANTKGFADEKGAVTGEISTHGTVLNGEPFYELELGYRICGDSLEVIYLKVGDSLRCYGKVGISKPYAADLTWKLQGAYLEEVLTVFFGREFEDFASGALEGEIKVEGPIARPLIKGSFLVRDGKIGDLRFDTMNVKVQGRGGNLYFFDSRVGYAGDTFLIAGDIDLTKIGKENIFHNLKITTLQGETLWEGWNRRPTSGKFSFGAFPRDFEIGFKRYANEPRYGSDNGER